MKFAKILPNVRCLKRNFKNIYEFYLLYFILNYIVAWPIQVCVCMEHIMCYIKLYTNTYMYHGYYKKPKKSTYGKKNIPIYKLKEI